MGKKVIKPRFFFFLLLVAVIIFALSGGFKRQGIAVVMSATASDIHYANAVIIRDEQLTSAETALRIDRVANDGAYVKKGTEVAYVYSSGYSEKIMTQLTDVRSDIQSYHTSLLANIIDDKLTELSTDVQRKATELRKLIMNVTQGNIISLESQLEETMAERQRYMSQNKREDLKLNQLYEKETRYLNSIVSWRNTETAQKDGIISYYTDGYEDSINASTVDLLTTADLVNVLNGVKPAVERSSRISIYRLVEQENWYIAFVSEDTTWNPIVGQSYNIQFDGFEDLIFQARVTRAEKQGGTVMAVLKAETPIGSIINVRCRTATIGTNVTGLSVPNSAIQYLNGQTGVYLNDGAGTFVPVEILSQDNDTSLIEPSTAGTLTVGNSVITG